MSFNFNKPPTKSDAKAHQMIDIVDDIAYEFADEINDLKALLSEKDLEIQMLEAKIKELKQTNIE